MNIDDYPGDDDWSECSKGHGEILYYCRECPLCASLARVEELEERLFELEGTPQQQEEEK